MALNYISIQSEWQKKALEVSQKSLMMCSLKAEPIPGSEFIFSLKHPIRELKPFLFSHVNAGSYYVFVKNSTGLAKVMLPGEALTGVQITSKDDNEVDLYYVQPGEFTHEPLKFKANKTIPHPIPVKTPMGEVVNVNANLIVSYQLGVKIKYNEIVGHEAEIYELINGKDSVVLEILAKKYIESNHALVLDAFVAVLNELEQQAFSEENALKDLEGLSALVNAKMAEHNDAHHEFIDAKIVSLDMDYNAKERIKAVAYGAPQGGYPQPSMNPYGYPQGMPAAPVQGMPGPAVQGMVNPNMPGAIPGYSGYGRRGMYQPNQAYPQAHQGYPGPQNNPMQPQGGYPQPGYGYPQQNMAPQGQMPQQNNNPMNMLNSPMGYIFAGLLIGKFIK